MANQPNQIGQAAMWVVWIFGLGPLIFAGIVMSISAVVVPTPKELGPDTTMVVPYSKPWDEQFSGDAQPGIKYILAENMLACKLVIYNAKGKQVKDLSSELSPWRGVYWIQWGGQDENRRVLRPGKYHYWFSTVPMPGGKQFGQVGTMTITSAYFRAHEWANAYVK